MMNQHSDDNFSFVTYKKGVDIKDYLDLKYWVENDLKILATKKDGFYDKLRNFVCISHFKYQYSWHRKALIDLRKQIEFDSKDKKSKQAALRNKRYYQKKKLKIIVKKDLI